MFAAWRGVTEAPFRLAELSQTLGRGAEFGLTQLGDGRVHSFGTGEQAAGESGGDERAEVLRRFGSWHAPIREVVEATPARAVLRHDLYRLPRPFPAFVGPDDEPRVALLGDAAHAIVPSLGQSGCLALEDAVELSHALATALSDRTARMTRARSRMATALRAVVFAAPPPRLAAVGYERAIGHRRTSPGPPGPPRSGSLGSGGFMNRVRRELPTPEELMAMRSEPDGPHYDPSEHDEADLPRER